MHHSLPFPSLLFETPSSLQISFSSLNNKKCNKNDQNDPPDNRIEK